MDETILKELFEKSQNNNPDKLQFSEDETTKFQKAFEDPEFRKLFSDYIDELQDPKNREENEAYIAQLEGEKKVPEGKELIRPEPVFVAKTHKVIENTDRMKNEKLFINVVQSTKIAMPTKTTTPEGNCWSVPYSLGPPHMEKDKEGANAPCFDCCFHPDALKLGRSHKEFRDLLVHTAMEGVEQMYLTTQNQTVTLSRSFHVVKGLQYKQGQVPTMMIPLIGKDKWKEQHNSVSTFPSSVATGPSTGSRTASVTSSSISSESAERALANAETTTMKGVTSSTSSSSSSSGPAIKRGFLTGGKAGALYPEKHIPVIRGAKTSLATDSQILMREPAAVERSTLMSTELSSGQRLIHEVTSGSTPVTATSTSTNNSNNQPGRPPQIELMKPISTVQRVAPSQVAPSRVVASTPRSLVASTPSDGTVCPKYSLKERGNMNMGDFEAMRSQATSSRPDELVYRIELPLATKASQVVLDVATSHLSLSYLDVYRLSLPLPYPVHDSRGSAKYDKASKSLTVTLPVVQVVVTAVQNLVGNEQSGKGDEVEATELTAPPTPVQKVSAGEGDVMVSSSNKSHSRWVSAETDRQMPKVGGIGLLEEVRTKAHQAVKDAAAASHTEVLSKIEPSNTPKLTHEQNLSPSTSAHFQASGQFLGRRTGFVFRNGDEGVGYYLDHRAMQQDSSFCSMEVSPVVAVTIASTSTDNAISPLSFPATAQQTRSALAVLVGVAHIVSNSVRIAFRQYSVDISFQAICPLGEESRSGKVLYGMRLTLVSERCPGGLDPQRCHHDVAAGNMALVLTKTGDGDLWLEESDDGTPSGALSLFRLDSLEAELENLSSAEISIEPASIDGEVKGNGKCAVNDLLTAMNKMQFSVSDNMLFDLD